MPAPRGEAARLRIIEATREVVLDGGLAAFSVEAVATASGAARSTIYRHWPEPRDLLVETLTSMGTGFPVPDTGSLESDLVACVSVLKPLLDDRRIRRLILDITRAATDDPDVDRIRRQTILDRRHPMHLILQRAIARGEVAADLDPTLAVHLIEGPILAATVLDNQPISDEALSVLMKRIVRSLA